MSPLSRQSNTPNSTFSPSSSINQGRSKSLTRKTSTDVASGGIPLVRTGSSQTLPTPQSSTVHPPLRELEALNAYITSDPTSLIQILPEVASHLEHFLITHPAHSLLLWEKIRAMLEVIQEKKKEAMTTLRIPNPPKEPICEIKPKVWVNVHGEEWHDDFAWLNDREDPDVLAYIEKENAYSQDMLAHTKPLQRLLYKEFVSRVDEAEESAKVVLSDGYSYYGKKVPGEEYRIHCRISKDGFEEVYLDENELANHERFEDASFFRVGFLRHSPDCKLIAYGIDCSGNERYTAFLMDMETRTELPDSIDDIYEDFEFSVCGQYVFYTALDDYERAYQLKRHKIGMDVSQDTVLYQEDDEMFFLSLKRSTNLQYIILNSAAQVTSETRYISAEHMNDTLHVLFPRRDNISYTIESHEEFFYVLTNEDSKNNWLFRVPVPTLIPSGQPAWEELLEARETVIEHRDFVLIEDFQLRRNHLIVFERSNCLQNVRIVDLRGEGFGTYHYVSFSDTVYSLWPGSVNEEVADLSRSTLFDTNVLRFTYTTFTQPKQVVDYNMDARTMTVVHEEKVDSYDPNSYASKRLFATGVDGTTIPVAIVYRKDLLGRDQSPPIENPLLLHAYGAYGAFVNPIFSTSRLSLLDRGFIYAVASVRGGADMGNGWYEEGKLGKKPNTFHDFISVAEYLIKEGYTSPSKLAIYGRSAGGLLIGASVNMRPELFQAALMEVPFVDVINTMFDASIPWTAFEYEEWGNPADYDLYQVMKKYCPYTNIQGIALAAGQYPHMLVVGGMNDPRVAFFEPLKFVAKLRTERRKYRNENSNLGQSIEKAILLKVDDAGHGGNSGQYSYLEDLAFEYAFLIASLGVGFKPIHGPGAGTGGVIESAYGVDLGSPTLSPIESPRRISVGEDERNRKIKNKEKPKEAGEYRGKKKGDRGQTRLFQWVTNFF